jgi:hypothetical protein
MPDFGGYGGGGSWSGVGSPPAPAHLRLSWSGELGQPSGAEVFSFGLSASYGASPPATAEAATAALLALSANMVLAFDQLTPRLVSTANLTLCKAVAVEPSGKVGRSAAGQFIQGETIAAKRGAAAPNGVAWQVAYAVTLLTAFDGAVGRGRFYLPTVNAGVEATDGRYPDAARDALVTSALGFVNAMNGHLAAAGFGRVAVASGGSVKYGIPAAVRPVLRVEGGRTPDTMRSRRSALPEQREGAPVA